MAENIGIDRATQVIRLIALGYAIKEIADELQISNKTVEYHYAEAKKNFGFACHADVTRFALRNKLISPEESRQQKDPEWQKLIDTEVKDYQGAKTASLTILEKAAKGQVSIAQITGWTKAVEAHVRLVESEVKLRRMQ